MQQSCNLSTKTCIPCQGGIPPLTRSEFQKYLDEVHGWDIIDEDTKLQKTFVFKDFQEALGFVNNVGAIAEEQGHHPDISLHDYKKVTITLFTHKIGGLHENDFILAAKIDGMN